jgi:sensory rhodopsin
MELLYLFPDLLPGLQPCTTIICATIIPPHRKPPQHSVILTGHLLFPLMCLEFYLLLKPAGAKTSFMWKLIAASVLMLVAGYIGEAFTDGSTSHSVIWGVISTIGYVYILYAAWFGEAKQLAASSKNPAVQKGIQALAWFVLVGWAIYPIGYMAMPGGWLSGIFQPYRCKLVLQPCRCYQ